MGKSVINEFCANTLINNNKWPNHDGNQLRIIAGAWRRRKLVVVTPFITISFCIQNSIKIETEMMIIDPESGPPPIRCDSTLSVIKIQAATRAKRGNFPLVTSKFSDPEIEELYQLHSTNRKRTELFRCFLYSVLFYCIAQIIVHSFWVAHQRYQDYSYQARHPSAANYFPDHSSTDDGGPHGKHSNIA